MIAQGAIAYNPAYGAGVTARIELAVDCDQLQEIATAAIGSLNATAAALTSQLNAIQADVAQVTDDAQKLYNHIATLADVEAAHAAIMAQAMTAPGIADLSGAIAYLKAQASVMITFNNSALAKLAAELLALWSEYNKLQTDLTRLQRQVQTLQAQIADIPLTIAQITTAIENAAQRFANCVVALP